MNPADVPAQEVERVTRLSEHDFRVLVDEDIRDRAQPVTAAVLRSSTVLERWYESLLAAQTSVEAQLAAKEAEHKATMHELIGNVAADQEAGYQKWKAGAIRFKSGVDRKLIEARRLLREQGSSLAGPTDSQQALIRVALLEQAIRKHRDSIEPDEATSDDLMLWSYVGR